MISRPALEIGALLLTLFASVWAASAASPQASPGGNRFLLTGAMAGFLVLMFGAQILWPDLLTALAREGTLIGRGQLWRLVTALFVQDGGVWGLVFNIVMLAVVGRAAERRWTRPAWLLVYFGGGVAAEILALSWQPVGAGNSVAYFALAGGLAVCAVRERKTAKGVLAATTSLAGALVLCWLRDIHGPAYFTGVGIALLLRRGFMMG